MAGLSRLEERASVIRHKRLEQTMGMPRGTASYPLSKPLQLQPESSMRNQEWSVDDRALIDKITLYIEGLTKTRNEKFYTDLLDEIALGPGSPRALTRELQNGLQLMLFLINQETATIKAPEPQAQVATIRLATNTEWSARIQAIIVWFRLNKETLPLDQFCLDACTAVVNPKMFYAQLEIDIAKGPQGPRARHGALQDTLEKLKNVVEGRE